jgi:hypothetical protein
LRHLEWRRVRQGSGSGKRFFFFAVATAEELTQDKYR